MAAVRAFLKKNLLGSFFPKEYLCMEQRMYSGVQVICDGKDITDGHVFAGYKPCIWVLKEEPGAPVQLRQTVKGESVLLGEMTFRDAGPVSASLPGYRFGVGDDVKSYLKNGVQRLASQWYSAWKSDPKDLLYLDPDTYDQVRLSYSVPRKVSAGITGENGLYNAFPTDLHGAPENGFYIVSLRENGLANAQVNQFRKLMVADLPATSYKEIYAMGKRHMLPPVPPEQIPLLGNEKSRVFGMPLPARYNGYKELSLIETHAIGVHRLHVFRIEHEEKIAAADTLVHVHEYYASWRYRNGFRDTYYL
jgi:hypothetical protein